MSFFYLLRHAESAFDPSLPESDWPLSPLGETQARSLVSSLEALGINGCISSPYLRAVRTVKPFAVHSGLEILKESGLRERKLSETLIPNWLEILQRAWSDFDFALPGAESSRQCQQRMVQSIKAWLSQKPGKTLVFSSHGNAIALFLNALDPKVGFEEWKGLRNPDIIRVEWRDGEFGEWERVEWKEEHE